MDLTCELNGTKYLLIEVFVVEKTTEEIIARCKEYECILQGMRRIDRGGFLTDPYVIVKVLVPEKNVIAWNNHAI